MFFRMNISVEEQCTKMETSLLNVIKLLAVSSTLKIPVQLTIIFNVLTDRIGPFRICTVFFLLGVFLFTDFSLGKPWAFCDYATYG